MKNPKRPCNSDHSISNLNPNNNNNNTNMQHTLLESFITITNPTSLTTSFNQILESQSTHSQQNDFIQRAIDISSALLEAAIRSRCQRVSAHNASFWTLPFDVTVKVFSMIDTRSVCNVAATCSFLRKCAMDPLCYANIDLVTLVPMVGRERTLVPKVNDAAVSTIFQRAGNTLQSIKLGEVLDRVLYAYAMPQSVLTHSCLRSLNGNGGAPSLRSLHLYNIRGMDNTTLIASLSVCPSLIDLEIVCLYVPWKLTLESLSKHIPLIERLVCESSLGDDDHCLKYSTCSKFVLNCPNITTLALKGFEMPDSLAHKLVKGFRKLKHVDFSKTYFLTGSFLKNLSTNGRGNNLEVMILRDTTDLKQVKVEQFLEALLAGAWKSLRHLDISQNDGLASKHDWSLRHHSTSFIPIKLLLKQRPNFYLLAEFGNCDSDCESEVIKSDESSSSQSGSDTSGSSRSPYRSTSDSSPDESSDDVDHHPV